MSGTALDKREMEILSPGNPDGDFDLDEDEISDLDFLRGLYPRLTNDQILELKERLDGYFDVALKIFLRKQNKTHIDE